MINEKQNILLEQADKKLASFAALVNLTPPDRGWIFTIRTALGMSLRQLGARLGITAQSAGEIESREANSSITLNSLKEAADALGMKLVYGLVPKGGSLEQMIEKRANEVAEEIVMRTSQTMMLEDQEVSKERIRRAVTERAKAIKNKMPKYLWD